MTAQSVNPPFPIFSDVDGNPLEDGFIYIGTENLNAETNPISVYWDAALTIPAAQPIRTLGGYPSRTGTPARIFANSNYSMTVRNKNGTFIYSSSSVTDIFSADLMNFIQSGTGAVPRTAQSKMRDVVSVFDFMTTAQIADVQNRTLLLDLSSAILVAITAANGTKKIYFPSGSYKFSVTMIDLSPTLATEFYGDGSGTILVPLSTTAPCFILQYTGSASTTAVFRMNSLTFSDPGTKTSCGVWTTYGFEWVNCRFLNLKYGVLCNGSEWDKFNDCTWINCQFAVYSTSALAVNDPLGIGNTLNLINPSEKYYTNCWFGICNCSYYEEQADNAAQKETSILYIACQFMAGDVCVAVWGSSLVGKVNFYKCWFEAQSSGVGMTINGKAFPFSIVYTEGSSVYFDHCRELTSEHNVYVKYAASGTVRATPGLFLCGTDLNAGPIFNLDDGVLGVIKDCTVFKNGGYSLEKFSTVENVVPLTPALNSGIVFPSKNWSLTVVQGSATGPFENLFASGSCVGVVPSKIGGAGAFVAAITTGDGFYQNKYLQTTACPDQYGYVSSFTSITNAIYVITLIIRQSSGIDKLFKLGSFGYPINGLSSTGIFTVKSGNWQSFTALVSCSEGGAAGGVSIQNFSGSNLDFDLSLLQVLAFPNMEKAIRYIQSGIYTLPVVL